MWRTSLPIDILRWFRLHEDWPPRDWASWSLWTHHPVASWILCSSYPEQRRLSYDFAATTSSSHSPTRANANHKTRNNLEKSWSSSKVPGVHNASVLPRKPQVQDLNQDTAINWNDFDVSEFFGWNIPFVTSARLQTCWQKVKSKSWPCRSNKSCLAN